ncbi:MAG: YggS family pyridoxal phosphate-dependent enzyme [Acidobacteria bacterium]|nr:MAG: YggS family pyridoxal phosphate-dependent enzyme [Acidobacteriota bacterium]
MDFEENIGHVRERIANACRRAGRRPEEVKLVAVSKTVPPDLIRRAFEAGLRDFGENRVQEANAKRPALSDLTVTWHMVGHLQSNKAKLARELFHVVHSVDSLRLAQKLDQAAVCSDDKLPVLLQVNLGDELTKSGAREEEIGQLAEQVGRLRTLELRGLMVLPPFFEDPEQARPSFRRLRELAKSLEALNLPNVSIQGLSMGMSHDFEIAIEEGATIVRIGTAIFGPRS